MIFSKNKPGDNFKFESLKVFAWDRKYWWKEEI